MLARQLRRIVIGSAVAIAFGLTAWPAARAEELTTQEPAAELHHLPLLFRDDFQSGKIDHWQMSDPRAWKVLPHRRNFVLSLHQPSSTKPAVRSPYNRAIIKDLYLSDCVIDVRMQSTVKDYNHRDLCVFLGYQDPKHYYYVHLAKRADKHANQIFIVEDKDRVMIEGSQSNDGTNWDDNWHHVRVVRKVDDGLILVYFDNMEKPVMKAVDKTYKTGQVGVGSFDDLGDFDNVYVYGTKALPPLVKRLDAP